MNKPVRVIRGERLKSDWAPETGCVVIDGVVAVVGLHLLGTGMTAFTKWKR